MNRFFLMKTGYMIILAISVIFYSGCEQPSEPEELVENQGVSLESIAQSSKQSLGNQFNSLRITLLLLSIDLQDADLSGLETYQNLMDVTNHSSDRIHGSGVVDWHGIVRNGYPSFVPGEDRSTDPGIVSAFATTDHFSLSEVSRYTIPGQENFDDRLYFDYLSPIMAADTAQGVVYITCDLDTLIWNAFVYSPNQDSLDRDYFLLEENGRIIYDSNPEFFDKVMTDTLQFSEEIVELADRMLNESRGHAEYSSEFAPGLGNSGGQRVVGWTRFNANSEYWWNSHWIIAVTEMNKNKNP